MSSHHSEPQHGPLLSGVVQDQHHRALIGTAMETSHGRAQEKGLLDQLWFFMPLISLCPMEVH